MKTVFLTSVFNYGGAQMSSIELAINLKQANSVKFFDTYGCSKPFINSLKENSIEFSLLSKSSLTYIVKKHQYNILNLHRYIVFFFKWFRIRNKVSMEITDYQPDIIIIYDYRSLSYLLGIKDKKFKTIFYAREWFTPNQISFSKRRLLRRIVDLFICVSEATKQALYCGGIAPLNKMFVIHNSINESKLLSNLQIIESRKAPLEIIHSGAFIPDKGQIISLEAAKILKKRNINFHLYLCGLIYPGYGDKSKKYFGELENYVRLNKLEKNVSFVVGRNNIISYINACDIMFFPSNTEGLPRSILEAMTLGKPVIANSVGGVTDLIIDRYTGLLAKHNDPDDYADLAQLMFNNKILYKSISKNAVTLIRTSFNEDIQIKKMNEIFKYALADSSPIHAS